MSERDSVRVGDGGLQLEADVLVLGGGPAGTWAALSAVESGANVVLADKGYCGTSGATAAAGVGVWYVPPDPEEREKARASREELGGYLAERRWMDRVLDETYASVNSLGDWGYPFPLDDSGRARAAEPPGSRVHEADAQAGEGRGSAHPRPQPRARTARRCRRCRCGRVRDRQARRPAMAGARGRRGHRDGRVRVSQPRAGVQRAHRRRGAPRGRGGSGLLRDGVLQRVRHLPIFASVTKTLFYNWATFTHEDGRIVEGAGSQRGRSVIARTLLTEPVFAQLDKASDDQRLWMRTAQPNFFLPFDRAGIDPFTQRFQITLRLEGTVRGTGGIRVVDDACATSAAGLFAAGDAATRERICGAFTGGGSHNAAWAISSGRFAGRGAAEFASRVGRSRDRATHGVGGRALRPGRPSRAIDTEAIVLGVQNEVMPYDKNLFRSDRRLKESSSVLDGLWQGLDGQAPAGTHGLARAREAAAGRDRAMDVRERPEAHRDPRDAQARRLRVSGRGAATVCVDRRSGHPLGASSRRLTFRPLPPKRRNDSPCVACSALQYCSLCPSCPPRGSSEPAIPTSRFLRLPLTRARPRMALPETHSRPTEPSPRRVRRRMPRWTGRSPGTPRLTRKRPTRRGRRAMPARSTPASMPALDAPGE